MVQVMHDCDLDGFMMTCYKYNVSDDDSMQDDSLTDNFVSQHHFMMKRRESQEEK